MITNCKNCGAILHFSEKDYGKKAICDYCHTEYHIDLLGRVEEYKVKLDVLGEIREFYIGEFITERIGLDGYRDFNGTLHWNYSKPKVKLNLIEL